MGSLLEQKRPRMLVFEYMFERETMSSGLDVKYWGQYVLGLVFSGIEHPELLEKAWISCLESQRNGEVKSDSDPAINPMRYLRLGKKWDILKVDPMRRKYLLCNNLVSSRIIYIRALKCKWCYVSTKIICKCIGLQY